MNVLEVAGLAGCSLRNTVIVHSNGVTDRTPRLVRDESVGTFDINRSTSNEGTGGTNEGEKESCSLSDRSQLVFIATSLNRYCFS